MRSSTLLLAVACSARTAWAYTPPGVHARDDLQRVSTSTTARWLSRRRFLSCAPALALATAAQPSMAARGSAPRVELLSSPDICQGRCRDQDFVVLRYTGRFADGRPFDERYATRPLIHELGSFYLPGVDDALVGACVGSRLRMTWERSPSLGPEYEALLPSGSPIELEMEVVTIRYSLFGEKMRDPTSTYRFTPTPLTLTSAADYERGHATSRPPLVTKDNPFAIAPGEKSIISNPTSTLTNLFEGWAAGLFGGNTE